MSKIKMKINVAGIITLCLCLFNTYSLASDYLIKNGKTNFTIVLSNTPQLVEITAAHELKNYLDEITNVNWIIVHERDISEDVPQILIGSSCRARKFFPEIEQDKLPYDGIEIHLKGNKLLLTGHEQRGVLYAVNTFLEDILGVRWWSSTEQTIPSFQTFKLNPLSISYAPKLVFRQTNYKDMIDDHLFAVRMKCNGEKVKIPPEYGGYQKIEHWGHSFYKLIPPDKYFADHPEWFSMINGVRTSQQAQLCLSNSELREELTKNALTTLRNNPMSKFIMITQEDREGFCTCDDCNHIAEVENAQSGPLIHFINAVAADIEKEFPEVIVVTFAYNYTRTPPKYVRPRHNVAIMLCSIECSFVQPLEGEQNQAFYNDIITWSKISQKLFGWDYVTNFTELILPHPNLRVLAPNIRTFVDHGAIGLYNQGDAWCPVGDFVRLRNWLISKLMWNPSLDENLLMTEFLEGYYGKQAAPYLLEYFNLLMDQAEASGKNIYCKQYSTDFWLDYSTLCKATVAFNKAISAAKGNKEFTERLLRERLPLEHVWLRGYAKFKSDREENVEEHMGIADPVDAYTNFFTLCDRYQVTSYREGCTPKMFQDFKENMIYRFKSTSFPDEFRNNDATVYDFQEYDFNVNSQWISFVDDPAASNGRAVKMKGSYPNEFNVRFERSHPALEEADENTKYKVILYARCDASTEDGSVLTYSVYNWSKGELARKNIDVTEIAGKEYRKIEFDPVPLTGHYTRVLFTSPKRKEVQDVFIDRVIIERINDTE